MKPLPSRTGYMFLLVVLLVGALALMSTVSLFLLSWNEERNGVRFAQSTQSLELARSCMDEAIIHLRKEITYGGDTSLTFANGTCTIFPIVNAGGGTGRRVICTEGRAGNVTRRLRASFEAFFAQTTVSSYKEAVDLDECLAFN
jgi:hypothetical protein